MNTCPTEPRLTAFLLGDLPQAEADAVRAHLASCPACGAAAAELAPLLDTLRAALAADAAAPLTLDPVRMAAILATPPPHRARRRRTRFWLAPVIGLAATGIIVLSASLFFPGFESHPYRVAKGSGSPQQTGPFIGSESKEAADGDADGFNHDGIIDGTEFLAGTKQPVAVRRIAPPVETDTEKQPGWTVDAWIKDGRGDGDGTYARDPVSGPERVIVAGGGGGASSDVGIAHKGGQQVYYRGENRSGKTEAANNAELKIAEVERSMSNYDAALERPEKLDLSGVASAKGEARFQKAQTQSDPEDHAGEREELARVKEIAPDHAEAALLEGKMNLKTGKLIEATDNRIGGTSSTADPGPGKFGGQSEKGQASNNKPASSQLQNGRGPQAEKDDTGAAVIFYGYADGSNSKIKPEPVASLLVSGTVSGMASVDSPPPVTISPHGAKKQILVDRKDEKESGASTSVKPRVPAAFNPFVTAAEQPLSTFAIDVDTASYTRTRQAILAGQLPEPEAVRTEEVVNAFDYGDRAPDHATFRIFVEGSPAPFGHGTSLVRLGIKGRRLGREEARPAVLTFVVDASGSMGQPDRFGLARLALDELIGRLSPDDRIQLIAFNDTARVLADPVAASGRKEILAAFDRIQCTGSTHLEGGLRLAYDRAAAAFRPGAENRVILLSDGVANLGAGVAADILTHIDAARRQGITLAVFGVGRGAYNDEMLEQLANRGDGTYRFLDSADEVRRAFVDDLAATLYNIASDVKIQVEWFPAAVVRYRQLGYENRALTAEQFRDDTVDAGEVGSGQSVTALYEIERAALAPRAAAEAPLGVVRVRYRPAAGGPVAEISRPILAADLAASFQSTRPHFRLAACAAAFAERLRGSPYANGFSFADVANVLRPAVMEFTLDARLADLLRLIETADRLTK